MTEGNSKKTKTIKQPNKNKGTGSKTIAVNKKAKTERLRAENKGIEICGGCNKPKQDCNCGAPTKYKPEYTKDIVEYFEKCQAEILIDVRFFQPNKNSTISTILNPNNEDETLDTGNVKEIVQKLVMQKFPTMIRYALKIDADEDVFVDWDNAHPEFLRARRKCKQIQEAILLENGLQGTYNSQFAIFLLKNNHGYKDKTEVETKQSISFEITDEQRAKLLERMELDE